ncbi:peptidase M23B [Alkaliphilus metalliredigens QYMF]|uniref:Peptidase M23B n=1 Tax=Alkaliphilus metalliredigens (strain QYMF) TaxID=293826 RepID=A6TP64_ALKMQ|nr:M23 family metallopeptidase [Alkaliphilus metalliredigens]ABR47982.1 peptidase M23B [Alkaliphilus metalliredigens QYMF]
MSRGNLDTVLTKVLNVTGILLLLLIGVEMILSPPEIFMDIIRMIILTGFILTALTLPLVKGARLWLRIVGLLGIILYIIGFLVPGLTNLLVVAILTGVLMVIISSLGGMAKDEEVKDQDNQEEPDFPLPGPSEKAGKIKSYAKYYISGGLALANPFQLYQMMMQMLGMIGAAELKDFQQKGKYILPFSEEWSVVNGGIKQKDSHSWEIINQRYAYDFVIADSKNIRHKNEGKHLNDYHCYDKAILSPGDGKVIEVRDRVRDHPHPGTLMVDFLAKDFRGNFVMLQHEEKEYSFMAHFIPGSVMVKKGDLVKAGQLIGKCGNSGHSTEPHLHLHFQDHPNFYRGKGLPIKFSQLKINNQYQEEAYIQKKTRVVTTAFRSIVDQ